MPRLRLWRHRRSSTWITARSSSPWTRNKKINSFEDNFVFVWSVYSFVSNTICSSCWDCVGGFSLFVLSKISHLFTSRVLQLFSTQLSVFLFFDFWYLFLLSRISAPFNFSLDLPPLKHLFIDKWVFQNILHFNYSVYFFSTKIFLPSRFAFLTRFIFWQLVCIELQQLFLKLIALRLFLFWNFTLTSFPQPLLRFG